MDDDGVVDRVEALKAAREAMERNRVLLDRLVDCD